MNDSTTGDPLLGALVRIKVDGSSFVGIVQRIDRSVDQYVSIRLCPDGENGKLGRPGKIMDFYGDELANLEVLLNQQSVPAGFKRPPRSQASVSSAPTTSVPHAPRQRPASTSMSGDGLEEYLACRSATSDATGRRPVSKAEWLQRLREEPARPIRPAANSRRPTRLEGNYQCLSELGEQFKEVILSLAESATVGVMCTGRDVSRNGELSLLAVSCRRGIYLFDLVEIGAEEALEAGLKEILESPHVLKVIHDCRQFSDMMHHKFHVQLSNVFETQAADWMIRRAEAGGMVPIHVNTLRFCLQRYLQLYTQEVRFSDTMKEAVQEDEAVWMKRPMEAYLLDCACRSVMYLPELHSVMLQALLAEYVQAVDIYLGAMRDLDVCDSTTSADVLPRLRREFAINAGSRNYAAPGRATSPERDGLHRVPRCDNTTVHDREVLNAFLTDHRQKHGDNPPQPLETADVGAFPFRSAAQRMSMDRALGFSDSSASEEERYDAGKERERNVGTAPVLAVPSSTGPVLAVPSSTDQAGGSGSRHSEVALSHSTKKASSCVDSGDGDSEVATIMSRNPSQDARISDCRSSSSRRKTTKEHEQSLPRGVHPLSFVHTPSPLPSENERSTQHVPGQWQPSPQAGRDSWKAFTGCELSQPIAVIAPSKDSGHSSAASSYSPSDCSPRECVTGIRTGASRAPGTEPSPGHGLAMRGVGMASNASASAACPPLKPIGRGRFFAPRHG